MCGQISGLRFSAKPDRTASAERTASPREVVNQKLETLEHDLASLRAWDQKEHLSTPVIQRLDIGSILRQGRRFLNLQAKNTDRPLPFLIGLAGGSRSGKNYTQARWESTFNTLQTKPDGGYHPLATNIELDCYYHNFAPKRKAMGDVAFFAQTNLDEPAALDLDMARKDVIKLKNGRAVNIPAYDMRVSARTDHAQARYPYPFVMVQGLFALVPETLRKLYDLTVFVDAPQDVRESRFWQDAGKRNLTKKTGGILWKKATAMHNLHIEPTKRLANIVLNGNSGEDALKDTLIKLSQILTKTFLPPKTDSLT